MPTILVQTKDPAIIPQLQRYRKPSYDVTPVSPEAPLDYAHWDRKEIHGLIADAGLLNPGLVQAVKEAMGDPMFPVILLAGNLSDREAGMWIGSGVSDIFQLPVPAPLMGRRIGTIVQLYCISQSLHGQVTDRLTGLHNRQAFFHFAKEMIQRNPEDSYSIILSDIENFKRVNEQFGEEAGDALLRFMGNALQQLNGEDILFARYGGDQFVGILRYRQPAPEIDDEFLRQQTHRLCAEAPIHHLSIQYGIYENVDKSMPISIMCDRAMMALKTIKHQYGCIYAKYTAQLQNAFNREQQILDSMEQALAEHQLQVYYQPKHDALSGAVSGAEALVRWIHPVYGFMSPGEFIPLFEKSGFITQMDAYIWNQVCEDIKQMQQRGLPTVPVSVNVSRKDLISPHFLRSMTAPIEQQGLSVSLLHMELTESVYMEDERLLAPIFEQIKNSGIQIELDDFGSGFSSLGILSKLPVDVIKLDISLIRQLETRPTMVDSIINMMHTLGYSVTAEGVETAQQASLLRKMGCDTIQGYYYSRPLTFTGFCEYMANA